MASSDPRLEDDTALEEINLYADLVIAASESEQRLSQQEIDRLLGVSRERGGLGPQPRTAPRASSPVTPSQG